MKESKFKVGDVVRHNEDEKIVFRIDAIQEPGLYYSEMTNEDGLHFEFYESELKLIMNKFHYQHVKDFIVHFKDLNTDQEKISFLKENEYKVAFTVEINSDITNVCLKEKNIYDILNDEDIDSKIYFNSCGTSLLVNLFKFLNMKAKCNIKSTRTSF